MRGIAFQVFVAAIAALPQWCTAPALRADGPIEKALDSVVLLRTSAGLGSGFVAHDRSLIVTNFHVIDGAAAITAELRDGSTIAVNGYRIVSPRHDLAILQLEKPAPMAPLAIQKAKVDLGSEVFALGSPKGLAGSVSKGAVGGYRRWADLAALLPEEVGDFEFEAESTWVQTDAAIIPGNSGGPLITATGEVIAVNTLASSARAGQNMNFAVSSSELADLVAKMPPLASPLNTLPKAKDKPRPVGPADETARRTQHYWNEMASVLGSYAADWQKAAIAAGDFIVSPSPNAGPPRPRDAEGAAPPKPATAEEIRRKRANNQLVRDLYRMGIEASQFGDPNGEFDRAGAIAAKSAANDARFAAADQAVQRRAQLRHNPLEYAINENNRRKTSASHYYDAHVGKSREAADKLDAIPADGVDPMLVEFATQVASALRKVAIAASASRLAVKEAAARGDNTIVDESLDLQQERLKAFKHLRDVVGPELKVRLRRLYGVELGSVNQFTPEQDKLFEGHWRGEASNK